MTKPRFLLSCCRDASLGHHTSGQPRAQDLQQCRDQATNRCRIVLPSGRECCPSAHCMAARCVAEQCHGCRNNSSGSIPEAWYCTPRYGMPQSALTPLQPPVTGDMDALRLRFLRSVLRHGYGRCRHNRLYLPRLPMPRSFARQMRLLQFHPLHFGMGRAPNSA